MGIYLGQLPPAEIARLKAELAETIIVNFCYPRFFDYRSDTLRMRPVDRAKRQEVWLYLSSVDFTAWSRVDLMSPDFQRYIERLFIQFVQRNRSFFGNQGRKRMPDIRMLITSSSASVVQGLRAHVTGQRQQGTPPFGSPRQTVSWSTPSTNGHIEHNWEHIANATMLLQQQLQEVRGEIKPVATNEPRVTNGTGRSAAPHARPTTIATEQEKPALQRSSSLPPSVNKPVQPVHTTTAVAPPPQTVKSSSPSNLGSLPNPSGGRSVVPAASIATSVAPATSPASSIAPTAPSVAAVAPATSPASTRKQIPPTSPPPPSAPAAPQNAPMPSVARPTPPSKSTTSIGPERGQTPQEQTSAMLPTTSTTGSRHENYMTAVGDDDIAIFEQMRHQLIVWLRVEVIHLGLDIHGQGPSQLLEILRQQGRFDETKLQVVSTLLDLSNQIIKNSQVSVLDYKQALMFYLMHTRR